ncbi:hypothetical protein PEC106568_05140 [Pectobacterium carotovorum subsp. carotovorum]|nr:hypothetical protein PEC106568_05140 [Pectobacterium carotovorum subsp. carotovorum]
MVMDDDGLKISKIVINKGIYGWMRTFGEVEMVPIMESNLRPSHYECEPTPK